MYRGITSHRRGGTDYATPIYRFQCGLVERRFEPPALRDAELCMRKTAAEPVAPAIDYPMAKRNQYNTTKTYKRVMGEVESDPQECVDIKRPVASRKKVLSMISQVLHGHGLNDRHAGKSVGRL
jgi:hypothetical protein